MEFEDILLAAAAVVAVAITVFVTIPMLRGAFKLLLVTLAIAS